MILLVKKVLAFITSALTFVFFATPAFADVPVQTCDPNSFFNALCNKNAANLGSIVSSMISAAFVIAIIIALGFLVYGGIKWILSEGDKSKVEESRNHVMAAIIGLIVVFLSYFILNIVVGFFISGKSLSNLTFPTFGFQ